MKRLLLLPIYVCVIIIVFTGTAYAVSNEVTIKVNDIAVTPEIPPLAVSGRVMVPLRTMCDVLGARLAWNGVQQTAIVIKSGRRVQLHVGSITADVDRVQKKLDVPPMLIEGTILVPARFIAESLGAKVAWNASTMTVAVTLEDVRDEMAAKDVYDKAMNALNTAKSYSFSGVGLVGAQTSSVAMDQGSSDISYEISGKYRAPEEVYFKIDLDNASEVVISLPLESQEKEIYSNGKEYYEKNPRTGWQKTDATSSSDMITGESAQDPSGVAKQLESIPHTVVFGDDVLVNGSNHYAIVVKPDPNGLKEYIINEITKVSEENADSAGQGADQIQAMLQESINQLFKSLRMDLTYKFYIDKTTLSVSGIETNASFKFFAEGFGTSLARVTSTLDISGINEPVEMPSISVAAH